MSFRSKLQTLLILLVGVSCGLLLFLSLRKANRLAFELIQEKVFSIVASSAPRVDGDKVAQLVEPSQDSLHLYEEVATPLREILQANKTGALPVRFLYIIRPLPDGEWEYVVDAETDPEQRSKLGDRVEFAHPEEMPVLGEARVDAEYARDSFGVWLTAFAPVNDSAGNPVAMLAADISADRIKSILSRLLIGDLIAMTVALALAAALAAWLSGKVTAPLTELQEFVRGIGRGDLSSRLELSQNDEFGELAKAINQMADGLEERESLKGALVHYVRSQAADARLGGSGGEETVVNRRVTVLVAELCGFGQLSSRLGGERVFALLNEYFSTMIDIVLRHQGSLEKSSDESVIAVFGAENENPHQERLAIQAALAMQNALDRLLRDWKIETNLPIFLEIGIHSDDASVRNAGAGEALDFDSVREIIAKAGEVRAAGRRNKDRLSVSSATAGSVQHTFPFTEVRDESTGLVFHRVEMPRSSRA
ncbi:MAG: HAMP domain-containing protein [Verrucomicrobiae bacterium]|nr:HAMP domain-containing protein [Verrucomicrobiae bacterium]